MYQDSGKKIVILYILKILRDYTDADHPMTQQDIADKLLSEYGIEVNRATIKRNLSDLIDAGYDIVPNEVVRSHINKKTGEKEENVIYTDLYYEHDFTESELHMLIDGLLFSRSVPHNQRKKLIDKLAGLSSSWFSKRIQHVHSMGADSPQNQKLFFIIDMLDEAIEKGKQVEIVYGYYGTDLQLHKTVVGLMEVCYKARESVKHEVSPEVQLKHEYPVALKDTYIYTDGKRLEQLVRIFLENACEHTKAGEVTLKVNTFELLENGQTMLQIRVDDTGVGIREDQYNLLFKPFRKLDRRSEGLGCGLALSREIAKLLDGRVYLDQDYRGGASFVFEMPLEEI